MWNWNRVRARLVASSCALLCVVCPAIASEDARDTLTLEAAIESALAAHPELRTAEALRAASDARVAAAGRSPSWSVSAEVENVLGTGEVAGVSAAEITVGVERVFELGNKRAARLGLAEVERDAAADQFDAVRLSVRADVTETYVRAIAVEDEIRAVERSAALAKDVTDAAKRRVQAGRSSQAEASRARVDVAELEIERLTLLNERATLHRELRRLTGAEPSPRPFVLAGKLDPLPAAPEAAVLVATLESAPALRRSAWERQLAQSRLRLAETQRKPDFSLSAGVRSFAESDDVGLVLSASMDLDTDRRARSGIVAARAELRRAEASATTSRRDLEARVRGFSDALALARRELELLNDIVIPESRHAEELLLRGYQLGRFSYLEIADAQRRSVDAQRRASALALRYHTTILELGRLLGMPQTAEGIDP